MIKKKKYTKRLCLLVSRATNLDFLHFSHNNFTISIVVSIPIFMGFTIGHYRDVFTGRPIRF